MTATEPLLSRLWSKPLVLRSAAQGMAWGMRLWHRLCHYRVAHYDAAYDPGHPSYRKRCVMVFWHEFAGALLPHWQRVDVALLISQHRDGEFLNELAKSIGYLSVRGSSTRGGAAAVRQMRKLGPEVSIGIAPDGPRGPRRKLALGPVYIASLLRVPIIPVGVGSNASWRLDTWDRFAIPQPFSRVRVVFGPPLSVPRDLANDDWETFRAATEQSLEQMNDLAQGWAQRKYQLDTRYPVQSELAAATLAEPEPNGIGTAAHPGAVRTSQDSHHCAA